MVGIYTVTNPVGDIYVGQSIDIINRWTRHKDPNTFKKQPLLNESYQKYGVSNHIFKTVHELPKDVAQQVLDAYEVFFINQFKEAGIKLLNLKDGGSSGKHHPDTVEKLRQASKGNKNMLGKTHSEETKAKISKSKVGKSPPWNKGKEWSQEAKDKMRASHLARNKNSN